MAQYIDKSALVAEIMKRKKRNVLNEGAFEEDIDILSFINTLEVKEADLEEAKIGETQIYIEDDGGEPPYDGKQWLDLGCLEYEIPKDKFRDGDDVEIIIRKIRKGE